MSQIAVTSEDLHQLSGQVTAGASSIQDQLQHLMQQVTQIADTWQGAAHSQFEVLYQEWNKSAAGLQDALNGIATLLNTAGTNYEGTETTIRNSFQGGN